MVKVDKDEVTTPSSQGRGHNPSGQRLDAETKT